MHTLLFLGLLLPLDAQQTAREIFRQLIEIDTTDSKGDNTRAAEAMAARFRDAGYASEDVQLLVPAPRKGNLVVRLRGEGRARPILFIGHLDVVEAKRSDWSFDPFEFREQDGYFYGRGTQDMKGDMAILVATFLRLKREGYRPARDMILALTSDEEGGPANGVNWLVENRRDLIDADFCINPDGGGASLRDGKRRYLSIQAAEKVYLSFKLEVANAGGHSSLPTRDNAIYTLAEGLGRLSKLEFPVHLFNITRTGFERRSQIFDGQLAADMKTVSQNPADAAAVARLSAIPIYNALMRTTCVATMLAAGHAENALPQTATATVNCRLLPVDDAAQVEAAINKALADPRIRVSQVKPPKPSPPSPIDPKVLDAVVTASGKLWPSIPLVPDMSTGGTDGLWLRRAGIPTYGVSGLFLEEDDIRAHGRDERMPVESFYQALDFMHDLCGKLGKLQ